MDSFYIALEKLKSLELIKKLTDLVKFYNTEIMLFQKLHIYEQQ